MADFSRPREVDERIQMHADALWQQQVAEDAAAEESLKQRRAAERNGSSFSSTSTTTDGKEEREAEGKEKQSQSMYGGVRALWGRNDVGVLERAKVGNTEIVIGRREPESESGEKKGEK